MNEHQAPNLLLTGAQKCGTTSLFRDLLSQPDVCFPEDKEPGDLAFDEILTDSGWESYLGRFKRCGGKKVRGDASTIYTMLPTYQDVPLRARRRLGPQIRILYIVRHPIDRIISQHRHNYIQGEAPADINEAVQQSPEYVEYSKYARQLEPWIDSFGVDRVHVVRFDRFTRKRIDTVREVCAFLHINFDADSIRDMNYRPTDGRGVPVGRMQRLSESRIYSAIRPLIPIDARRVFRRVLLPRVDLTNLPTISETTIHWLAARLTADIERQPNMFGWERVPWSDDNLLEIGRRG